jgi:hypothetical protein
MKNNLCLTINNNTICGTLRFKRIVRLEINDIFHPFYGDPHLVPMFFAGFALKCFSQMHLNIFPADLRRYFCDFFYVFNVVNFSSRFPLCALCVSARKIPSFLQLCAPSAKNSAPLCAKHLTSREKNLSQIYADTLRCFSRRFSQMSCRLFLAALRR